MAEFEFQYPAKFLLGVTPEDMIGLPVKINDAQVGTIKDVIVDLDKDAFFLRADIDPGFELPNQIMSFSLGSSARSPK